MHALRSLLGPGARLAATGCTLLALAAAAAAQTPAGKAAGLAGSAAQACEREARDVLTAKGSNGVEVAFAAAPAVQQDLSNESQVVLRGVARWKKGADVRSVSYSCNVDVQTFRVGLVLRDSTPTAASAAPGRAPAEPDLSELSPAACESSAVQALKRRWPRVAEIAFDPSTRQLRQPSAALAQLHGSGRAVPAPGSPPTFFGYDCDIDPRDGRVLRTAISS